MDDESSPLSSEQIGPSFQTRQPLFDKIKAHKTAFILASFGLLLLLSMGMYVFLSPSRKTLIMPATLERSQVTTSVPSKAPTDTPSPMPTLEPATVITWKTYTNSTYKYNIKYPPDWIVKDLGSLEPKVPSYIAFNTTAASSSARHITISVTTRTYEEQLALGSSSSAITVAGIKGTKQSFKDSDGNTSTVITLPRSSNLLVLRAKTAYLSIFDLMLTTLKVN